MTDDNLPMFEADEGRAEPEFAVKKISNQKLLMVQDDLDRSLHYFLSIKSLDCNNETRTFYFHSIFRSAYLLYHSNNMSDLEISRLFSLIISKHDGNDKMLLELILKPNDVLLDIEFRFYCLVVNLPCLALSPAVVLRVIRGAIYSRRRGIAVIFENDENASAQDLMNHYQELHCQVLDSIPNDFENFNTLVRLTSADVHYLIKNQNIKGLDDMPISLWLELNGYDPLPDPEKKV